MDLSFLLKKTIEALVYPSGLFFILFFLGTVLSFSKYKRSRARGLLVLALGLFYLSSTPFLYRFLANPLERHYKVPVLTEASDFKAIVLLPSYISNRKGLALQERFGRETWARFWAAVELKRAYPTLPLIIVGNGSPPGRGASYLALMAHDLELSPVKALDAPRDTASSVRALVPLLRGKRFLVVTSAYHLPRVMFLMRQAGLEAYPYPAFYLTRPGLRLGFSDFWPQPYNFLYLNRVINEYCGLIFYWIKAKVAGL